MLSAVKAVFSHLWNIYVFFHTYSHSTAFTQEVLWNSCAFRKKKVKALWRTYVNVGRYILKINIGSVPLLFPCQRLSSIIGPGKAVNGLINSQSRALGGRCLDCRSLPIRVIIRGQTKSFDLCYWQIKIFGFLFCNILECTERVWRCTFVWNYLQLFSYVLFFILEIKLVHVQFWYVLFKIKQKIQRVYERSS